MPYVDIFDLVRNGGEKNLYLMHRTHSVNFDLILENRSSNSSTPPPIKHPDKFPVPHLGTSSTILNQLILVIIVLLGSCTLNTTVPPRCVSHGFTISGGRERVRDIGDDGSRMVVGQLTNNNLSVNIL